MDTMPLLDDIQATSLLAVGVVGVGVAVAGKQLLRSEQDLMNAVVVTADVMIVPMVNDVENDEQLS